MVLLLSLGGAALPAVAEPLVPPLQNIGFSLDDDWRQQWRRILDRHGRAMPGGPIQQRFEGDHRYENSEGIAVSDYLLGNEWRWTGTDNAARWWVHSYDALRLGTHVQMKGGGYITDTWRVDMRFDRLATPETNSDLVEGRFLWQPPGKSGPFVGIHFYPRLEKQDIDLGVSVGYRDERYGRLRLRLYGLDTFSNGSYALAKHRDADGGGAVLRQIDVPLAVALELQSVRLGGFRFEAYAGGVLPQRRWLFTEGFTEKHLQREAALLFSGMLEYRVQSAPLWIGLTGSTFFSSWQQEPREEGELRREVEENTYQARAYFLAVLDPNVRLESAIQVVTRPERRVGFEIANWKRKDWEVLYHTRLQWLMSDHVGLDLSGWRLLRQTEGPPEMDLAGRALRFDVRCLLRMERFLATFGLGLNPLRGNRPLYSGGGGSMVWLFD